MFWVWWNLWWFFYPKFSKECDSEVEEFWKSVENWLSYRYELVYYFFGTRCTLHKYEERSIRFVTIYFTEKLFKIYTPAKRVFIFYSWNGCDVIVVYDVRNDLECYSKVAKVYERPSYICSETGIHLLQRVMGIVMNWIWMCYVLLGYGNVLRRVWTYCYR